MSGKLEQRLREVERRVAAGSVTVLLQNGRTVHVRDPLALLVAAFHRKDAKNNGEPLPASEYAGVLDSLTESAPAAGCEERLVATAAEVLRSPPAELSAAEEGELRPVPGESPPLRVLGRSVTTTLTNRGERS